MLGNLPPVILTGNHNRLHVTFSLPGNLLELFPESLCSGEGISLCPVLFNVGLQQINESSSQYKLEQQINEESLIELRSYYRAVRCVYVCVCMCISLCACLCVCMCICASSVSVRVQMCVSMYICMMCYNNIELIIPTTDNLS